LAAPNNSHALDHIVVVLFENRSFDNVLGHLYGPEDGKTFEGVIGKNLGNPIPEWAQHGTERKVVPYSVATDMDSPNPDSGEEYFHTNTQLFNTLDEHNRFAIGEAAAAPWNAPPEGATPTTDGFVTDYVSTFTGEIGFGSVSCCSSRGRCPRSGMRWCRWHWRLRRWTRRGLPPT
jgi:phospholipase C